MCAYLLRYRHESTVYSDNAGNIIFSFMCPLIFQKLVKVAEEAFVDHKFDEELQVSKYC